jgi:regulatory protein
MTVTNIEPVTKTRYKVFIDEQFAFVLYKGELSRYNIEKEAEIDEAVYQTIRKEVVLKRAKLRAMHLLTDMGRTEFQLRTKLTQGGYPEDIVAEAIDYVKSFGYINDEEYARSFILSRKDKKSRREICGQLRQKGLDAELIDRVVEECYQEDDSLQTISSLMQKRHFDPDSADDASRQKMMGYLVRKGFRYEEIRQAMQRYRM